MSTQASVNLTVQEARLILGAFNTSSQTPEAPNNALTRQALLLLAQHSDYQILGVCADTPGQGSLALKTYAAALGYEATPDINSVAGSVYIKFNPRTGLCQLDSRPGKYRGVLVAYQSSQPEGINELYGHLPLDLFMLTQQVQ